MTGPVYLLTQGMNASPTTAQILPSACKSVKLVSALANPNSNFTTTFKLSVLKLATGTPGPGNPLTNNKTCELNSSQLSCVAIDPDANLNAGDLIQVKLDNPQKLSDIGSNLYASVLCEN